VSQLTQYSIIVILTNCVRLLAYISVTTLPLCTVLQFGDLNTLQLVDHVISLLCEVFVLVFLVYGLTPKNRHV
jgi:hypothetical protein